MDDVKNKIEEMKLDSPRGSTYSFFGATAYSGTMRKLMNNCEEGTDIRDVVYAYNLALEDVIALLK